MGVDRTSDPARRARASGTVAEASVVEALAHRVASGADFRRDHPAGTLPTLPAPLTPGPRPDEDPR